VWNGKTTRLFDPSNSVFEELRLCCLLCRSTVFKHTENVTKGKDKKDWKGTVIEEGVQTVTTVPFWTKPVKMRETAGDASETGFVRFLEELKLKGDQLPTNINWEAGVTPRPILDYDKFELTAKPNIHPAFAQYNPGGTFAEHAKAQSWPQGQTQADEIPETAAAQVGKEVPVTEQVP
jgi:hypothetical protein